MPFPPLTADEFREWLERRHESDDVKRLAARAIDNFELVSDGGRNAVGALDELAVAAAHPRFVVWEVALPLLSRLAEVHAPARVHLQAMSQARTAEVRRRSLQYLGTAHPRSFVKNLLVKLLGDKSAQVRGFAAGRVEQLDCGELLPALDAARSQETNVKARFEITYAAALLRDGFHEMHEHGYCVAVRTAPGVAVWIRQFAGNPLTPQRLAELGIAYLQAELRKLQPDLQV